MKRNSMRGGNQEEQESVQEENEQYGKDEDTEKEKEECLMAALEVKDAAVTKEKKYIRTIGNTVRRDGARVK